MACGDRYVGEVVTVDGYTPKNPYGVVAIPGDYVGWRGLAEVIYVRLNKHWQQLGSVEPSPAFWNANVESKNELAHRVDDLPSPVLVGITGQAIAGYIDDSVKVILDMNCFRERIHERLVELGQTPEELPDAGTPDPATKPGDWIPQVVGGAVALGLAYVGVRYGAPLLLKRKEA